ncbi:MAG: NUDIX hydrolase [Promicromonosporaceae bacterium]|nr:NUDIX hydrolase [Promicromonosporaceae bacterium]
MSTLLPIDDEVAPRPSTQLANPFCGWLLNVVVDEVDLGDAGKVKRECIKHPGAVAILALDDEGRIALVNQYRHAVKTVMWEIPAGLLDCPGETPLATAQRELAEEADLLAARWDVLVDYLSSPGFCNEAIRIFLARDLTQVPEADRHERGEEELAMQLRWVPLEDVAAAVLAGRLHSPSLAIAALAALASRAAEWNTLRPADAHWRHQPGTLPY